MQRNSSRIGSAQVIGSGYALPATPIRLGLYTDLTPNPERLFGEQTSLFTDLAKMGADKGVEVVILTPGYTNDNLGWRLLKGKWTRGPVTMPDIVLRRTGTFRKAVLTTVATDLGRFRRSGRLHTLPRVCGNKWTILSQFRNSAALRPYLPETRTANSGVEVFRHLQRLGDVYAKPFAGAQGISVYHISKVGAGAKVHFERRKVSRQTERLTSHFDPDTIVIERSLPSQKSFIDFWRNTRMQKCIVQETIVLPTFSDGRPFDFRWLVQYIDRPKIVARVARVGRPHAVTTNIHTGGTAMAAEEALKLAGLENSDSLVSNMDRVAILVAEHLKKTYGPYAEVGIDLACRPDASIVIFEVNPTPGRRMLRSLGEAYRKLSLECLLEYAIRANR